MGNYYIWRAKHLVSVVEMEQGRVGAALTRIEAIIEEEKSYFDGKFHCMMDQNLNQLIRITQRSKDYAKTEDAIS